MKFVKPLLFVFFSVLCALTFAERAGWIMALPYPPSSNGYFYLQEYAYRAANGAGYYSPHSPFFTVTAALGGLFGLAPFQILTGVIVAGLIAYSAGLVLIGARSRAPWLLPALVFLAIRSDVAFYRHYAHARQAFSLGLTVAGFGMLVKYLEETRRSKALLFSALFFVMLGCSFHIFSVALVGLLSAALALSRAEHRRLMIGAAAASVAVVTFHIFDRRMAILGGGWGMRWGWQIAEILTPEWVSPFERVEFRLYCVFALFFIVSGVVSRVKNPLYWALWLAFLALLLPVWRPNNNLLDRLCFSAPWIFFIAAAIGSRSRKERHSMLSDAGVAGAALSVWICSLLIPPRPPPGYDAAAAAASTLIGTISVPPRLLETNAAILKAWIPEHAFILAPRGSQYKMTYFLGRSSAWRIPPSRPNLIFQLEIRSNMPSDCFPLRPGVDSIPPEKTCVSLGRSWIIRRKSTEQGPLIRER